MKNVVINFSMNLIESNFPDCNQAQLEGVKYGLEGIYLSISKMIIISIIAWIIGIFKEMIIILLLFNILRATAFGLHASKSWMCWISSSLAFLGGPLLCIHVKVPFFILVSIACFCLLNYAIYAPADTAKRPLIKKKKRIIYRLLTLTTGMIYLILLFFIKNTFLQNALVYAMIIQMLLIHPMIYRLFKLSYNNYKSYVFSK